VFDNCRYGIAATHALLRSLVQCRVSVQPVVSTPQYVTEFSMKSLVPPMLAVGGPKRTCHADKARLVVWRPGQRKLVLQPVCQERGR
jgi:hypothetical protein